MTETSYSTKSVQSSIFMDHQVDREIMPPISVSTAYELEWPTKCFSQKYLYSRFGNPTRDALESVIADLDGTEYGE